MLYLLVNGLYQNDIIDPRNKGYGLNYQNKLERPAYNRASILALAADSNVQRDKASMIAVLEKWKAKKGPINLCFI